MDDSEAELANTLQTAVGARAVDFMNRIDRDISPKIKHLGKYVPTMKAYAFTGAGMAVITSMAAMICDEDRDGDIDNEKTLDDMLLASLIIYCNTRSIATRKRNDAHVMRNALAMFLTLKGYEHPSAMETFK